MTEPVLEIKLPDFLENCPISWQIIIATLHEKLGNQLNGFSTTDINNYLIKYNSKIDDNLEYWTFETERGLLLFEITHGSPTAGMDNEQ